MNLSQHLKNKQLFKTGILINGKWIKQDRTTFEVTNPSNKQQIAQVSQATDQDLIDALDTSIVAQLEWRQKSAKQRSIILRNWYQLIIDNQDDLATILTIEQGKPLSEARNEILYGASYIEWYSEEAKRINGYTIAANNPNQRVQINFEPIGVCAAITPWNFPNAMLARKVAPALAAGCSMIAKPSSLTPLSANALANLALEAGVPAGLFNIIHGHSGKIGEFLCTQTSIRKLSFTGSTEVGIWLYQNCANSMKKLSLELGGNAPLIIFPSADLDNATIGIMQSKFRNNGQTCVCSNRILVHSSIKHELITKLLNQISMLKLGSGLEPNVTTGPLINNNALIHIQSLVNDAIKNGASLHTGGRISSELQGLFFEPTLIECPNNNIRLFHEEIFGPILAIYTFETEEEAIKLANQTPYGLASYLFSQDIGQINRIMEQLQYGIVGVNTGLVSAENVPFGGIKMSGLGKEGGKSGIKEYLIEKYICLSL